VLDRDVASVRPPAVAGSFYPADPDELAAQIAGLLAAVPAVAGPRPKALIVPHAGYVYSGPIAASAFALWRPPSDAIERVVLVGPAHRIAVRGLAWPGVDQLATPLGTLDVDVAAIASLDEGDSSHSLVRQPLAHEREHCLEVMLPFLQTVTPHARIIPLLVSHAGPERVGRVLDALWGGPETAIVISSDLSHYLPYDQAKARDRRTADRIVARDPSLEGSDACGATAIDGLLWLARRRDLRIELVDLRSSGDTAGDRSRVVGYGAFACYEGEGG